MKIKLPLSVQISFTFLNCCFGSGLLAIPQIAIKIGIVYFILFNIIAALFSGFCFVFIIKQQEVNKCRYKTLTNMISAHYGKYWIFMLDLSIIFCLLPVSYIAVSADSIADAFSTLFGLTMLKEKGWKIGLKFICTLCIMYPLTLLKTIKLLNFISSFCIIFVFFTVFYVLIQFIIWQSTGNILGQPHSQPRLQVMPLNNDYFTVFSFICMFMSLYSMSATIPCIMREYVHDFGLTVEQTVKEIKRAVFYITIPIAFTVYTGFGLVGVLLFNSHCEMDQSNNQIDYGCFSIQSNVLLAFTGDISATVIELLFSLVVFVSFPCMLYPIRKSIADFFKIDANVNTKKGYLKFNLIGFIVTIICLIICSFLNGIDEIQSFTANLLGIVLYGLSGVMLWYKIGRTPIHQINVIDDAEQVLLDEGQGEYSQNQEQPLIEEQIVIQPQIKKTRTVIFWIAVVILISLNCLALGSQVYGWVR
ncbi:Amino acid transporter family protein [Spironucleus salmonicida]|uniref:Amino acid transporter family protein n=1 Tax=Spironucleus salmonicida TaxID=348837 RepID=V6LYY6_9EUKA|nr:Amino acid transporter family protein [Spironucleus salmonicida]|eukprot:EST49488.1 Amino acid transporter family protein [Spironucleus salmonicida]